MHSDALLGLAENPALPPHLLDVLVTRADGHLAYLLAQRDDLSAEQARVLAGRRSEVRRPETDPGVALVRNPDTPPAVLVDRLDDADLLFRWELARRTDLPQWVYERLAKDAIPGVRYDVAANPAVGESILRALAADRDNHRSLVHNPAIPVELLVSLGATTQIGPSQLPRVATASDAELRALAASPTTQVRTWAAVRDDLPADVVDLLAADPDVRVVKGVVTNPAITVDQLWALVDRHGPPLYARAARNPNCPTALLHHLARSDQAVPRVYREIAKHPNADAEVLLMCLPVEGARRELARHPNLPTDVILELLDDPMVRLHAAANPSLPESVMAELLGV